MEVLIQAFHNKYPKYDKILKDFEKANNLEVCNWEDITKLSLSRFVDYLEDNYAIIGTDLLRHVQSVIIAIFR